MKAIILAANDNPQLRPLTLRKLGALIKINGVSLLERQIRGYSRAGVETASISVVSGYQHGQIKRCLMREHPEIRLVKNPDYRSGSALYSLDLALRSAEPHTADEGLFIRSGECVYDHAAIERASTPLNDDRLRALFHSLDVCRDGTKRLKRRITLLVGERFARIVGTLVHDGERAQGHLHVRHGGSNGVIFLPVRRARRDRDLVRRCESR